MQPYYQDSQVTLYNADCRDVLPHLEGDFFVFTDPPYNVGKDYKGWDDSMPLDEYYEFCQQWISLCKCVSSEMCIYPPKKHLLKYWGWLGESYQQIVLTWTPEGAYRSGYVDQYAVLLSNAKPKRRTKNVWNNVQVGGLGYFFKENNFDHPGYTSEDITSRAISSFSEKDKVILDPFGGTGTTARVAKNHGLKCVTIEFSESWCEFIATKRLRQLTIFDELSAQSQENT